ncbi:hypothetical protein DFH11DRAFT_787933 [Phellopilus nigrolimitatus]|nr:hypothetical protein DFH11DRAFT_787933 [Phellopilus nigrolimitatus]
MGTTKKTLTHTRAIRQTPCQKCRNAKLKCEKRGSGCVRCAERSLACGGPCPTQRQLERKQRVAIKRTESHSKNQRQASYTMHSHDPPITPPQSDVPGLQHSNLEGAGDIRGVASIGHVQIGLPNNEAPMFANPFPGGGSHGFGQQPAREYAYKSYTQSASGWNEHSVSYHQQIYEQPSLSPASGPSRQKMHEPIEAFANAYPSVPLAFTSYHTSALPTFNSSTPAQSQGQPGAKSFDHGKLYQRDVIDGSASIHRYSSEGTM